ncbi:hypothetical protein [Siccirubricoccus phaeus]|uniref:hypothetical protein n=1 Tax=Siccirubricoccus phaeus TaxID=2595053 RepID=UPI0011F2F272|nr:hypothetical protein [Siccirubricoccus phaeus]
MNADSMEQAQIDLALAQDQIAALGVILAAIAFVLADEAAAKAREAKAARRAARKPARKPAGAFDGLPGSSIREQYSEAVGKAP